MPDENQIKGDALFQLQQKNTQFNGPHIFCDGLKTPDNLGSILRVADAAGCNKLFLIDSELDPDSHKIKKLSRSSQQHLDVIKISLKRFIELHQQYRDICAIEITNQSTSLFNSDISHCDAIVIGHEKNGIRKDVLSLCSRSIHLPMFGINGSMNVSHALVVFLYEWRRQQC